MKILIADDELVSRKKLGKLLQSLGYETIVATNGQEAWELWKHNRSRLIITDWMMPEMDGLELCRKVRAAEGSQYTYIVMVTSRNEISDIVTGMEAGADDFLTKPFNKEELIVRIRSGERVLSFSTRDIVIFSMAKLAESRSPETGNHLERIRHYSRVLTESLASQPNAPDELDSHFIENIYLTSPLHDIGKIGMPDHILLKPGRFDDEEFEQMKQHTIIGHRALSESLDFDPRADYLRMSAEIALNHHEKWNGTGYPNKLKGKDIPLPARIVALADVYDALATKRIYKNAYQHDMVRGIILQDRGVHFDPMIVDAFLACEKTFLEINKSFAASE